jgi:hypothetical protein
MNRSNPRRRTVPESERLPRAAENSSWPSNAQLQEPNFSPESDRIQPRRPQPRRSPLQERPKSALSGSKNRGTPHRLERSSGNRRVGDDPGIKFWRERRLGGNFSALGAAGSDCFFSARRSVPAGHRSSARRCFNSGSGRILGDPAAARRLVPRSDGLPGIFFSILIFKINI